jgi:type I site-specific restriction endonuclease
MPSPEELVREKIDNLSECGWTTDDCHRSTYNLWRQVLEYFDAYLIGLTAMPSKQTIGFFNKNLEPQQYCFELSDLVTMASC